MRNRRLAVAARQQQDKYCPRDWAVQHLLLRGAGQPDERQKLRAHRGQHHDTAGHRRALVRAPGLGQALNDAVVKDYLAYTIKW